MPALLLACLLLPAAVVAAAFDDEIPTFQINLDLPPRQRWRNVSAYYRKWYEANSSRLFPVYNNSPWTNETRAEVLKLISQEIKEELIGLVEGLGIEASDEIVDLFLRRQAVYEFGITQGLACSGIVATNSKGETIHGRNLDIGGDREASDFYAGILFHAEFVKGGTPIVRSVNAFSTVGVHTGVRLDGGWSVEQNTRLQKSTLQGRRNGPAARKWVKDTVAAAMTGNRIFMLELRRVLLETPTFLEAVEALSTTRWLSPNYFVLAGTSSFEGAVVTVERAMSSDPFYDIMLLSKASGKWYLVQTNEDYWQRPLDPRRQRATSMIEKSSHTGPGVAEVDVMAALRSPPVCNKGTIFSWVCTPNTGKEKIAIGDCSHK